MAAASRTSSRCPAVTASRSLPGQSCTLKVVWAPIGQGVTPRQGVIFLSDANGSAAVTGQAPVSTAELLPLDFEPRAVAFTNSPPVASARR